jgi:hypothetical protein
MIPILRAIWASRCYYWRLLCKAFPWAWAAAGAIGTAISIFGPPILRHLKTENADAIVNGLVWQLSLFAMFVVFLVRIIAAPYWMHQEDEDKRKAAQSKEEKNLANMEADRDQQRAKLAALLDNRQKAAEQKSCLSDLMVEGKRLKDHRHVSREGLEGWLREYGEWAGRTDSEISHKFSVADAMRLSALEFETNDFGDAVDGRQQRALCRISTTLRALDAMFDAIQT